MITETKSLLAELKEKLNCLDKQRDEIWKLEFRDFEDLSCAICRYKGNVEECDLLYPDIHYKLTNEYIARIKLGEIKIEGNIDDKSDVEDSAFELAEDYLTGERNLIEYHWEQLDYFTDRIG